MPTGPARRNPNDVLGLTYARKRLLDPLTAAAARAATPPSGCIGAQPPGLPPGEMARSAPATMLARTPPAGAVEPASTGGSAAAGIYLLLSTVSMGFCAWHGVKRHNGDWRWGIPWGLAGASFPVFAPVVAIAQGPGEPLPPEPQARPRALPAST